MELDTQGKMISVFRVGLKHKQNKTHRVSHWMDRKKLRQDADFPALSRVLWFILGQNLLPLSPGEKGRSEVCRMKITFPGFMFYWKEALGVLDSHGPQQEDSGNM